MKTLPCVGSVEMRMLSGVPVSASEAVSATTTPSGTESSTIVFESAVTCGLSLSPSTLRTTVAAEDSTLCSGMVIVYEKLSCGFPNSFALGT